MSGHQLANQAVGRPRRRRLRSWVASGAVATSVVLLAAGCGSGSDSAGAGAGAGASSSGATSASGTTGSSGASGSSGGSSGTSGGSSKSSTNTTLTVATAIPPASFDPIQADNSTVDMVNLAAYDPLIKYGDNGQIVGALATKWSTSASGKSVSFTLRSGVTFQDGTPLTASDVKWTFDRIKKLDIDMATYIAPYVSTTVVNAHQLVIHLSHPYTPFIANLDRIYILNASLVEKHLGKDEGQSWLATHVAGSGPYKLVSYTPGEDSTFTRYAGYWGGWHGQANTVVYKYLTAGASQRQALLDGDADIALDIDPDDWATFKANKSFAVSEAKTNVELYAVFKMKDAPTTNKDLREAIAYAFDYQADTKDILKGAAYAAKGVLPTGMMCSDPNVVQPTYDLTKAKALVAKSGLKGTTLTVDYQNANAEEDDDGPLLQSELEKIGLKVKLSLVTFPEYFTATTKLTTTPDIGFIYTFPQTTDPDAVLYDSFDSKFIDSGDWGDYDNPAFDSLVQKAQELPNGSARCGIYDKAQQIAANDYPAIDISNPDFVVIYSKKISGYVYEPTQHQTVDVYKIKMG